jgi:HTH-type transcriptional regulator / antitoxin HigA
VDNVYEGSSSGSADQEKKANRLAQNWLIDRKELIRFVQSMPEISKDAIEVFASSHKRHPGIIVGQLQYAQLIGYNRGRGYLVKVSPHLKDWMDPSFNGI